MPHLLRITLFFRNRPKCGKMNRYLGNDKPGVFPAPLDLLLKENPVIRSVVVQLWRTAQFFFFNFFLYLK